MSDPVRPPQGFLTASVGSFVGGVGTYLLVALIHPASITTAEFLSFDAKSRLGLEFVSIIALLMVATLLAAVGCWIALRGGDHARAGATALVTLLLLGGAVIFCSGVRNGLGPPLAALATIIAPVVARAAALGVTA